MNRPSIPRIFPVLAFAFTLLAFLTSIRAQTAGPQATPAEKPEYHSVWDGIYTESQAARGESLYHHVCAECHGDKLAGREKQEAPSLAGKDFQDDWSGDTVADLFKRILRKMPDDDPGSLTPQQTADLVAFLLSFNKYPAGKTELPPDAGALTGIRFDVKAPEQKKANTVREMSSHAEQKADSYPSLAGSGSE
jgi:S-disulfanyl-L-cysteine oxidoreductase SoxD